MFLFSHFIDMFTYSHISLITNPCIITGESTWMGIRARSTTSGSGFVIIKGHALSLRTNILIRLFHNGLGNHLLDSATCWLHASLPAPDFARLYRHRIWFHVTGYKANYGSCIFATYIYSEQCG